MSTVNPGADPHMYEGKTTTKHTAEPWIVTSDGDFISIRSTGTDRVDWQSYVAKVNESETFDQDHANAARIVACVNKCAGIQDLSSTVLVPAETVAKIAIALDVGARSHRLYAMDYEESSDPWRECIEMAEKQEDALHLLAQTQHQEKETT